MLPFPCARIAILSHVLVPPFYRSIHGFLSTIPDGSRYKRRPCFLSKRNDIRFDPMMVLHPPHPPVSQRRDEKKKRNPKRSNPYECALVSHEETTSQRSSLTLSLLSPFCTRARWILLLHLYVKDMKLATKVVSNERSFVVGRRTSKKGRKDLVVRSNAFGCTKASSKIPFRASILKQVRARCDS